MRTYKTSTQNMILPIFLSRKMESVNQGNNSNVIHAAEQGDAEGNKPVVRSRLLRCSSGIQRDQPRRPEGRMDAVAGYGLCDRLLV